MSVRLPRLGPHQPLGTHACRAKFTQTALNYLADIGFEGCGKGRKRAVSGPLQRKLRAKFRSIIIVLHNKVKGNFFFREE